ncbi:MAG: hypothetical protein RIT81_19625 [Deltaproteobacteria bacterium]
MKLPLTGALVALLALQTGVIVYGHARTTDEIQALRAAVARLEEAPKCRDHARPTPAELEDPFAAEPGVAVPFEVGATELAPGDLITIDRIVGERSSLEVGGHYVVHGRYRLASHARAKLLLSVTTTDQDAAAQPTTIDLEAGEGTFTIPLELTAAGYPHVTFYEIETGRPFSGVYFGHDAWLLRTKSWRYADD